MGYYKAYENKDNSGFKFKGFTKGSSADKLNIDLDSFLKGLSNDPFIAGLAESLVKDFLSSAKKDIVKEYNNMSDEDRKDVETELKKMYYGTSNDEGKDIVEYFYKDIFGQAAVPWKLAKKTDEVSKISHGREMEFADLLVGSMFYNDFGTYIKTANITTDRGKVINAIKTKGVGAYKDKCGLPLFFKPTAKVMEISE